MIPFTHTQLKMKEVGSKPAQFWKSSVTINVINVQYQDGGSDCGLFAVAMASISKELQPVKNAWASEALLWKQECSKFSCN